MLRLANGDIEYLVTNLSREEFSNEDIAALYRKRWDIGVSFRHQKYAIGGIVFHSQKLNVQQMELYTALTLQEVLMLDQDELLTNLLSTPRAKSNSINLTRGLFSVLKIRFTKIKRIHLYLQQGKRSLNLSS